MAIAYVQSPLEDGHGPGVRIFLAGGAKQPWRARFAALLEGDFVVYDPINFDWHEHALERRIDWEIRHFERADIVAAWLPEAPGDDFTALSPTTCFELGQLVSIKSELRVGIAPGHPARALLVERLRRHQVSVVDTLEELAAGMLSQPRPPRPAPRLDEERQFTFGPTVPLEDLFDLGVAVRTCRVRVTIDPASPMARELTAQLARLLP
jgi:hypothetical protein